MCACRWRFARRSIHLASNTACLPAARAGRAAYALASRWPHARLSGETCAASMWHRLPRSAAEAWDAISGQRSVASAERRMPCSRSPRGWRYAFSLDAANSTWNGIPVSVQTRTSSGWQRRPLQIQAFVRSGISQLYRATPLNGQRAGAKRSPGFVIVVSEVGGAEDQ